MKHWQRWLAVLTLLAGVPAGALAGEGRGVMGVSGLVGGYMFDNSQDIEKNLIGGIGFHYDITDHWGAEVRAAYGRFDHEYFDGGDCVCCDEEVDAFIGHLDALYHFTPESDLVPYLAAGIGMVHIDGDHIDDDDTYAMVNYGGGIKYFVTDRLAVRADIRHVRSLEDSWDNAMGMVGVTYTFGGARKVAEKKPEIQVAHVTPAPAPPAKKEKAPAEMNADTLTPTPVDSSVTINLDIQFDRDKSIIKSEYHERLRKVADFLKANPDTVAIIEGHTCTLASADYNLKLSWRRANAVRDHLIRLGIPKGQLKARGYGMTRPIADNATEEGRMKNRRVVVVVVKDGEVPPSTGKAVTPEESATPVSKADEGRKLRDLSWYREGDNLTVALAFNGAVPAYRAFRLKGPDRLVVDLPGQWDSPGSRDYAVDDTKLKQIRLGANPENLRLVFDLPEGASSPAVEVSRDSMEIVF